MRTILVIEDDPAVLDNMHDLLEGEGFFTIGAPDGRQGIKQAILRQPDLIICDVMMPEVDGYEVLRHLRTQDTTRTIPFIFVTARADRSDLRAGMDLGADDYLVKPFTADELLSAVNTRLERHDEQSQWYEQRIQELRSNLSRSLPHELRTPLSCILGYSQFLLEVYDNVSPDELRSMLAEINASGKRLERLVENYYLYAQLELSAADPSWRAAMTGMGHSRPEHLIPGVVKARAGRYEREADLDLLVTDGAVLIQPTYLEKIVEEVVDNAFKFSKPGTPVRVAGLREEDFYVLEVADAGRGMTAEQQEQLDAFVQFDRRRYEQQGLGLGLSIARRLVEIHQGAFKVESAPEAGTTIWVWLPLAE